MIESFAAGRRAFDDAAADLRGVRQQGGERLANADMMLAEAFQQVIDEHRLPFGLARALHEAVLRPPAAEPPPGPTDTAHARERVEDGDVGSLLARYSAVRQLQHDGVPPEMAQDGALAPFQALRLRRKAQQQERALADGSATTRLAWPRANPVAHLRHAAKPAPLPEPRERAGQMLRDRFVLDAEVGHGGMGVVYRAVDRRRLEMDAGSPYVALKLLSPAFASDITAMRALEAEARHTQELSHPNILAVHDFDRDGDDVFMVMEYLVGRSADLLLKQHPEFAGSALARRALVDLLSGLANAHGRGVAHADLKPSNLFICTNGQLKILDFGIAAVLAETRVDADVAKAVTPAYASPERLAGGPRSLQDDLYAVGCLVHLFVTGKHPFNRVSALDARAQGLTPPPLPGMPAPAEAMVNRALAFDEALRPKDAGEMLEAFRP